MCDAIFRLCFGGSDGDATAAPRGSSLPTSVEMTDMCVICRKGFTITVRKHECTRCNRAFCGDCMARRNEKGVWEAQRVCIGCDEKEKKLIEDDSRIRSFEEDYAGYLKTGVIFIKHNPLGFPHRRLVRISDDFSRLIWYDPKTPAKFLDMTLHDAKVTSGKNTAVMRKTSNAVKPECCFSIVGPHRIVDLEAESVIQRDRFVHAMEECIWVIHAIQNSSEAQKRRKQEAEDRVRRDRMVIEEEARARVEQRRREREEKRHETVATIAQKFQASTPSPTPETSRSLSTSSTTSNRLSTEVSPVSPPTSAAQPASEFRKSVQLTKAENAAIL
eukprot:TRINITY_DN18930_c0_g1_i1.p1 TRINITY_DN18930_c0_g1~~TRINITY_DN18930_c0_g1_i1.p1  ORF type:complete len:331 (+),score=61.43 TRINITY_DN18930_c0_g1_i1:54-1046(+)